MSNGGENQVGLSWAFLLHPPPQSASKSGQILIHPLIHDLI